jgi:Tol biopolymer transport system component
VRQGSGGARRSVAVSAAVTVAVLSAAAGGGVVPASGEASGSRSLVGVTQRVSVSSSGGQANGVSDQPAISADGRYVAFTSRASNLVAGDTNADWDVFVRNRDRGTTWRVSVGPGGAQVKHGTGEESRVAVSASGRYVAFESGASRLVRGDTNGEWDVFVRDRSRGVTRRVSLGRGGVQGNAGSGSVAISASGRYVAFTSDASNLVAGDTNVDYDVFVRDRRLGTTRRVSLGQGGVQPNWGSDLAAISAHGRYVAFYSRASNLVAGTLTRTMTCLCAIG